MNRTTKILLTLPSIIAIGYILTSMFTGLNWLAPTMKAYYIQIGILDTLLIMQLIVLTKKIWSFKNLGKSAKIEWTIYLIIFNIIATLIVIWSKLDEFENINKNTAPATHK